MAAVVFFARLNQNFTSCLLLIVWQIRSIWRDIEPCAFSIYGPVEWTFMITNFPLVIKIIVMMKAMKEAWALNILASVVCYNFVPGAHRMLWMSSQEVYFRIAHSFKLWAGGRVPSWNYECFEIVPLIFFMYLLSCKNIVNYLTWYMIF